MSWIGTKPEIVGGQEQREAMRSGAARVEVTRRAVVHVIGRDGNEELTHLFNEATC